MNPRVRQMPIHRGVMMGAADASKRSLDGVCFASGTPPLETEHQHNPSGDTTTVAAAPCRSNRLPKNVEKYDKMYVTKRDGTHQKLDYGKVTMRIAKLCYGLHSSIDASAVAQDVIAGLYPGIPTSDIDTLAAIQACSRTCKHPDYGLLAGRIAMTVLHGNTKEKFSDVIAVLASHVHSKTKKPAPLVSSETIDIVAKYKDRLDKTIVTNRDMNFHLFGIETLKRSYLLKQDNGDIVERPQHMYMRVAIGIHGDDIEAIIQTYHDMSKGYISHASPTMFQGGTPNQQLMSCFLLGTADSIRGIYKTLSDCAMIARKAGGIGMCTSDIRASESYIAGTNGHSNGLVPMLRVFDSTSMYVDQGGNKRPGAFATYLEPWHADIFEWLELRREVRPEKSAPNLFYGLWVPDLFMRRVANNETWTLMCPAECPGLTETWGEAFEALYEQYEREGRGRKTINAQVLWSEILSKQLGTGMPYMMYKDTCNRESNQQNLGTIKCSNLCTEIVEFTSETEIACCTLGSLVLSKFARVGRNGSRLFDFKGLEEHAYRLCKNLNKVIDRNTYDLPEQRKSSLSHRPIGIGFQGLADTFAKMHLPWELVLDDGRRVPHPATELLNKQIVETTYHGAMRASIDLAREHGPYTSYVGSPLSRGMFQFDLSHTEPTDLWDWQVLRSELLKHGARNSLLLAPMPTASTAQILNNSEGIEPVYNNIFKRQVLSGEFQVINPYLVKELDEIGLWTDEMPQELIANYGSIQETDPIAFPMIAKIPLHIRQLFKTVWEISQAVLIDLAVDRQKRICQSQSFNLHFRDPKDAQITTAHFRGWRKGLKTGMYYLRTSAAANPVKVVDAATTDTSSLAEAKLACSRANPEACVMCVAGHTQVLTTEGPQNIDVLATIREDQELVERMERRKRVQEDIRLCNEEIKTATKKKELKDLYKKLQAFHAILESCGDPDADPPRKTHADPIKVWNGHEWSEVVCRETSNNAEVMRITTSHGAVLVLTPEHKMIMRDGQTRKLAKDLVLGDALVPTPPVVYEGIDKHALPGDVAFRLGFMYGFAIANASSTGNMSILAPIPTEVKIPVLRVRKATVTQETLDLLNYDYERVRKINPKDDHENMAFIGIRDKEQQIRVLPKSPIHTRLHWVRGFIAAVGPRLGVATGHMLAIRAVDMLRSVGEDARVRRVHEHELWSVEWPSSKEAKMKPVGEVALLQEECKRLEKWLVDWKQTREEEKAKAEAERLEAKTKAKTKAIEDANNKKKNAAVKKRKPKPIDDVTTDTAAAADGAAAGTATPTDNVGTATDTINTDNATTAAATAADTAADNTATADADATNSDNAADTIDTREPPVPMPDAQPDEVDPPVIIGIEHLGVMTTTYCFTEPKRHAGIFNNQLTGQCSA